MKEYQRIFEILSFNSHFNSFLYDGGLGGLKWKIAVSKWPSSNAESHVARDKACVVFKVGLNFFVVLSSGRYR